MDGNFMHQAKYMKRDLLYLSILIGMLVFVSCKKDPGSGGNSSINGYTHLTIVNKSNLDDTLTTLAGTNEDVFIIYGDEISYGEKANTGYDGKFEFKFLRKGKYKVYVYSESYNFLSGLIQDSALIKTVEITEKKQTLDAGTFEIVKYR